MLQEAKRAVGGGVKVSYISQQNNSHVLEVPEVRPAGRGAAAAVSLNPLVVFFRRCSWTVAPSCAWGMATHHPTPLATYMAGLPLTFRQAARHIGAGRGRQLLFLQRAHLTP